MQVVVRDKLGRNECKVQLRRTRSRDQLNEEGAEGKNEEQKRRENEKMRREYEEEENNTMLHTPCIREDAG